MVEPERFDYIPQAAASLQVNKRSNGRYTPGAWWVSGLGDHILRLLFGIFDGYEAERGRVAFEEYLDGVLTRAPWGDQEYMRPHLRSIALRVRETLDADGA